MLPHQQRVIDEKAALGEKIAALSNFISVNPVFDSLDVYERGRLMDQYDVMCKYADILEQRIAAFV